MARIKLNKSGFTTCPTLILQNRRFQNLGNISKPCDLTYKENLNSANELSFTVFKKMNDNILYIWDKILCNKVLYSPELNERFIIQTPISEDKSVFKQVTAKSLCESELSQIVLYNVEINTETDILRDNYVKTTFYNPDNPKASILNRILDKAPHYSIGYVQPSLINIEKVSQFSFNDKDIYSALTDDIAKEFNCIFIFDSMTRTISAYDLYNTCEDCGFRGDFNNECPECGSKNFSGKYGKDTTIFISNENLATDINLEPEFDQLKNCMYVEGGDDIINAAIRSINPNGSNYIYYFNNETKDDMSSLLRKYLEGYDIQYNIYNNTHTYYLAINSVAFYNEIVQYIYDRFGEDSDFGESINKLPTNGDLIGYPSTTNAMYNSINLYYILKTSMMPTIDTEGQGIEDSLKAITDGFSSGFVSKDTDTPFTNMIAVRDIAKATKSDIERAIEKTARIFYSPAYYDLKVHTLSYSIGTWIGTIELESLTETDENGEKIGLISSTITLAVIESNELYTQQEIYRAIANKDKLGENQICSLKLSDEAFKDKITYYSLDELNHIQDMFNSCNDVLVRTDEACNMDDALLNKYKEFCTNRISFVISEKETRNDQIEQVKEIYFNGDSESQPCGELYDTRNGVNKKLNFEAYIKSAEDGEQLWNEFCSYRREDKYSNSNYISDGKTDSEIIEHATKLMDVAKKEMYKAGTMQYSLTATINNLLAIPEFEPLVDAFEVGNWIRVRINGIIYQLRLLSYTTDFSDLNKLSVEFSTVEKIFTGFSDVQSVLNSTASMVSSYPGLVQQMDATTSTTARVNNWVEKGLNATLTKYVDSDNEEIVVDNHGILGRHYDYITNTYDPYQLKILSNGLYTTHDSWNTIDAGVGRFTYYDPELDKWVDDYGIIAKTVVGKLIMGEKLKIYGANNSIILDDNGITLDGGAIKWKSKLPTSSVDGLDDELSHQLELAEQGIKDAASALSRAESAETNAKSYADTKDSDLSTNLTSAYENYSNSKVKTLDDAVAKYLGLSGSTTQVTDKYLISPLIYGGYLDILSGNKRVIIDPQNLTKTGYIFQVHNGSEITVGIKSDGSTTVNADIIAKSLSLGTNKISTTNISGLSTVATSGSYTDLGNKPDLTVYATTTSVNDALKNYAKSGDLEAYLKTNDLSAKLNKLNVAYNGDVITTQTVDSSTGLITTTNKYKDSSGVSHEYTTYTYKDSNYVLLNRTNQWGSGNTLVKIEKDGLLTAKNAIIYGTIYATSGEFSGELKSATGTFSGYLKCGGAGAVNPNRYQYELTDDGLHMGLSDGDTRWMFNIEKNGAIFSYGSFAFGANKFQYNSAQNTLWLYSNDTARSLSLVPNDCAIVSNDQIVLKNSTRTIGLYTKKEDSTCAFRPQNSDTGNISLGTSAAKWKDVYASTGTIQTSDRNKKKNINMLENKYIEFFKRLLPVSYQFKNGTSGRTHIGFISQDVEQAMFEVGLTDLDFAGFCKDIKQEFYLDENGNECSKNVYDEDGNPVYEYSLRYDEFIALNTHMIQSCLNKLETLESRIEKLEKTMAK